MQGPIIDLVLLALLILFFGVQQRGRGQRHFQLWFFGWTAVFASLIVWEPASHDHTMPLLQQTIQFELLLVGILLFLMSFSTRKASLVRVALMNAGFYVPAAAGIVLVRLTQTPAWVYLVLIVIGQGAGIVVLLTLVAYRRREERLWLVGLCLVFAIFMSLAALQAPEFLPDLMVGQLLIAAGVLYAATSPATLLVRLCGAMGFLAWGIFHVALGSIEANGSSRGLLTLGQLWSIPKYTVAFAMILEIFESQRVETARLATGYRDLYDDFRLLYERHPHPMWIHDAVFRQILSANTAAATAYGYSMEELLRCNVADLEAGLPAPPSALVPLSTADTSLTHTRHRTRTGELVTVEIAERAILFQGREARVVLAVDVTEKEMEARELIRRANHDILTGLPNRALLAERMQDALASARDEGHRAAIVTLDLDHFKQVNDTFGHLTGDEVLRAVAERLCGAVRLADTVARTGGEEFTIVLGDLTHAEDARRITAIILQTMREPLTLSDRDLLVTISIGVTLFPDDATDAQTLLRLSDEALYSAKRAGRNRVVFTADLPLPVAAPAAR